MTNEKPMAIFVLGRPGSGKDTQADILAQKLNLIRVSTSDLLKEKLYGPDAEHDDKIQKEKDIFESGVLNTPSWVLSVVKEYVGEMAKKDFEGKSGLIFSGSPRTLYESENLVPFLESIFGKKNLFPIYLDIPEGVGIQRITKRNKENHRPLDAGKEKLNIRTKEFNERTWPAIQYFSKFDISLIKIDGTPSIESISKKIIQELKNRI